MLKRYMAIWFHHLKTDWMARQQPGLKGVPFVMAAPERGRVVIKAANAAANARGINIDMVVADCRAILPELQVFDDKPTLPQKLLPALAEWCLRYTPVAAVDGTDGLILDISGCAHLWGGEALYLEHITVKLKSYGYNVRAALADTIGTAWAVSRCVQAPPIVEPGGQLQALLALPPAALRLDASTVERLQKLGFYRVQSFINMPRRALHRRFGQLILTRLDQALGQAYEAIEPIQPAQPYNERLPCLEPVRTEAAIKIALQQLLQSLCLRLAKEEKGLRKCVFKCYRVDGIVEQIEIGTSCASQNIGHLFKLFELKIPAIEPALGIEVFTIDAPAVEDMAAVQDALWNFNEGGNGKAIGELLDRIAGKLGADTIHSYAPDEHHWPERSFKASPCFSGKLPTSWRADLPRPIHLLPRPERIEVTESIQDYPPVLFKYKGETHTVCKADGPERIEQEWWLEQGPFRDYYCVEDQNGARYWLFRQYSAANSGPKWFIHGFFA